MAINGNTLAVVEQKLTNITTTEATFREGLDDVSIELSAIQEVLFAGQSPSAYASSGGIPVSVDAIRGLDGDVVPADLSLLGNASTATGVSEGSYGGPALTRAHLRLLASLTSSEYQAIAAALNGINTVSEEIDTLNGVYTENTGTGLAGPKPGTSGNAGEGDWLSAEDLNKLVGWSANVATAPNDLNKLTAISAEALEINSLASGLLATPNGSYVQANDSDFDAGLVEADIADQRVPGNVDDNGNPQFIPAVTVREVDTLNGILTTQTIQNQLDNKLDLSDTDPGNGIILTESTSATTDHPQITISVNAGADFEFDADTEAGGNNRELALASPATGGTIRGQFSAGEGIDISNAGVISGENASTTNRGVASFTASDFSVTNGAVSIVDSGISHADISGVVADQHVAHSTVSITAGTGLTGGGTIAASRTLNVGEGTGITVGADAISTNDSEINHDALSNFVANEHINHTTVSITGNNGLTGGGTIAANRTIGIASGGVTTARIAADAVDGTKIADNSINSEHYVDGSIDRIHLANDVIDSTKLADNSVNSEHYVDGSIDTAHIADGQITGVKLASNAIVTVRAETTGTPSVADFNGAIFLAEY